MAAALWAIGITNAHAQWVTNSVNINILLIPQGATNTVDVTNTLYVPEKSISLNTAGFLREIGRALATNKGVELSRAAKLVLLTDGNEAPLFAVVDGANFYGLTNTMMLIPLFTTTFRAGTQNGGTGLAFPTMKTVQMAQLAYSDTSIVGGSGLQFVLQGLEIKSITDKTPESGTGTYSETSRGTVTDLFGQIALQEALYFGSGSMSFSGEGVLVLK